MELLETYAFKFPRRISLRSKLAPKEGRLAKQAAFLLSCVDEKDAKSFVARKERNVCKGNLSRLSLPRNRLASSAAGGAAPVSTCFSI